MPNNTENSIIQGNYGAHVIIQRLEEEGRSDLVEKLRENGYEGQAIWDLFIDSQNEELGDSLELFIGMLEREFFKPMVITQEEVSPVVQSKPMALPFDDAEIPGGAEKGYWDIDGVMNQETADQEKVTRSPEYLGSGAYGLAVEFSNGHIGKYTDDEGEVCFARSLIKKPLLCFVKVFAVKRIQRKTPLWVIEMEKLQTLDTNERDIFQASRIDFKYNYRGPKPSREKFVEGCINNLKNPEEDGHLSGAFWDLIDCLSRENIKASDAHARNVGWNYEGKLVILDLGDCSHTASSSWQLKYAQSKDMPLPFITPPDIGGGGASLIDELMSQETADKERQMGHVYNQEGSLGVTSKDPKDSKYLSKYTESEPESDEAKRLLKLNPQPSCTAEIYNVELVQYNPPLWRIDMEKLKPLEDWGVEAIRVIWSGIFGFGKGHEGIQDDEIREYLINRLNWHWKTSNYLPEDIGDYKTLVYDFIGLLRCLDENKIVSKDVHGRNVGYKENGILAMFDFDLNPNMRLSQIGPEPLIKESYKVFFD